MMKKGRPSRLSGRDVAGQMKTVESLISQREIHTLIGEISPAVERGALYALGKSGKNRGPKEEQGLLYHNSGRYFVLAAHRN